MYPIKDYLFVLNPSDDVNDIIKSSKCEASKYIGEYPSLYSKAHLSLWHKQKINPHLMNAYTSILERRMSTVPPINVTINGFDYFVHRNNMMTIYDSIESTSNTTNWFKFVRKQFNLMSNNFVPHITVTRSIHVNSFYTLWPQFRLADLEIDFVPKSISVLERDSYKSYCPWRVHKELFFSSSN
jgi:2'-5' RNA ligase